MDQDDYETVKELNLPNAEKKKKLNKFFPQGILDPQMASVSFNQNARLFLGSDLH